MALIFSESCDLFGSVSDFFMRGWQNDDITKITLDTTGGPFGGRCFQLNSTGSGSSTFVGIQKTPFMRSFGSNLFRLAFWMKSTATGPSATVGASSGQAGEALWMLNQGGAPCISARLANNAIAVMRAENSTSNSRTVCALGTAVVNDGSWHHVEFEMVIHASAGSVKMWVDGVLDINSTGIDTDDAGSSLSSYNRLKLGSGDSSTGASDDTWFDDILLWDDSNGGFTGALPTHSHRIETTRPGGPGVEDEWEPNLIVVDGVIGLPTAEGGNERAPAWLMVDDQIGGPGDGDGTYNQERIAGRSDIFAMHMGGLEVDAVLTANVVAAIRLHGGTETGNIFQLRCRGSTGGTPVNGGIAYALADTGGSYVCVDEDFPTDPSTGLSWASKEDLDEAQFGYHLQGEPIDPGAKVRVTRLAVERVIDPSGTAVPVVVFAGYEPVPCDAADTVDVVGFELADADDTSLEVRVRTFLGGTVTLAQTTGLSFSAGDGTADDDMTFTGTVADINAAIATITYQAPSSPVIDNLRVTADDGVNANFDSADIQVSGDFPIIAVTEDPVTTHWADAVNILDTEITDADDTALDEVTLSCDHGILSLAATAGLSFTVGDGTGDATMTFSGDIAAINTALATITYAGIGNYVGSDTITVYAEDADAQSDEEAILVTLTNHAIEVSVPAGQQFALQNTPKLIEGIVINDAGDDDTCECVLSCTNGTLTLATTAGLSFSVGDGTSDVTMTFSGTATNCANAVTPLTYTPTSMFIGNASVSVAADDGPSNDSGLIEVLVATKRTPIVQIIHRRVS